MEPKVLAIIGTCPKAPSHVVRTAKFADFQRICGELEKDSYLAGHAACHATFNGFQRVIFVNSGLEEKSDLRSAFERLQAHGSFSALIIPGLVDEEFQLDLCQFIQDLGEEIDFKVFLDVPRGAKIDDVIKRQRSLPEFAAYIMPWVLTHSPGRRNTEYLPASTVCAGLCLGLEEPLRGVHYLEGWDAERAELCAEGGVYGLYLQGLRQLVSVHRPKRRLAREGQRAHDRFESLSMPIEQVGTVLHKSSEKKESVADSISQGIEESLMQEIDKRCAVVLAQHLKNDKSLWQSLRRTAESVLRPAVEKGLITRYIVRCDEETASWGKPNAPVMEILLVFAQRVSQVQIRTHRV